MHFWLFFVVAVTTTNGASTAWDACWEHCRENFQTPEENKDTSTASCITGCSLFSESFVETPKCQLKKRNETPEIADKRHPKVLPVTSHDIHVFKSERLVELPKRLRRAVSKTASFGVNPSQRNGKNSNTIAKQEHSSAEKQEKTSSSKTTAEPTSQPVQDHPVEANKQTTTTDGPTGDNKHLKSKEMADKHKKQNNIIKQSIKMVVDYKQPPKIVQLLREKNEVEEQQLEKPEKRSTQWMEKIETAKHCCRHECVVNFKTAVQQEGCVVGCNLQATNWTPQRKVTDQEIELERKSPFGMFQRVFFNLAGHVGRLIRVSCSWLSSLSSHAAPTPPSEKAQVHGSEGLPPQRMQLPTLIPLDRAFIQEQARRRIEQFKMEQNNAMKFFTEEFPRRPHTFEGPLFPYDPFYNSPRIITILRNEVILSHKDKVLSSNLSTLKKTSKSISFQKLEDAFNLAKVDIDSLHPNTEPGKDNNDQQSQHQLDLLECISRKSGLPRWFIAVTIFTSAIVVLWLCFSLTAPPDDIKVVKTKPPELETLVDDDEDYEDDLSCSEKKKLLASSDDVIKIRFENV